MSNIKKPGGQDDEKSAYTQESEAKESSAVNMHTQAKVAFRGAEWHARDAERGIEQARRPMKDMPAGVPPTGDFRTDGAITTPGSDKEKTDEGDEGDEGGDTSEGKSGKGDGGGKALSPDLTLDTSGYTAFSDAPAAPKDKGNKINKNDGPEGSEGPAESQPLPDVENKIGKETGKPAAQKSSVKSALSVAAPKGGGSGPGGKGSSSGPAKSGPGLG